MRSRAGVFAIVVLTAVSAAAQDAPDLSNSLLPQQKAAQPDRGLQAYQAGVKAMDEKRWDEAAEKFREAAAAGGSRADDSLYWYARALKQLNRHQQALERLAELQRRFPQSSWVKEAKALELEIRQKTGRPVAPQSEADDELKLLAINSLMNSDPERAIPMLEKVLAGNSSLKVKEQALFVLTQTDSPRAREVLAKVATGQMHPDLQTKAVQYLGIEDSPQNRQHLVNIYNTSADARVKRAVLDAFLIADAKENLIAVARNEKDSKLRREAIDKLGAMGATGELRQMFQTAASAEEKEQILQSLGVAGDVQTLAQIARTPGDPQVRRQAVEQLGIHGGEKETRALLLQIYASDNDREVKEGVVQALFIQDAAGELIELARKETDPQMRREIVEKLSIMDSKEAKDFMLEILNR